VSGKIKKPRQMMTKIDIFKKEINRINKQINKSINKQINK